MIVEKYEFGQSPQTVERRTLDNGIVLLTHRQPSLEGKVLLMAGVNAGSRNDGEFGLGISHFIEHCCFRGTNDFSGRAVTEEIEELGGEWEAETSVDSTLYAIDIEHDNLGKAARIMSSLLFEPRFGPRNIEKERHIILQEMADYEHDYDAVLDELFLRTLFAVNPIRNPILGSRDTLNAITRDRLFSYHKKFYSPGNITLYLSGDHTDEGIDLVAKAFCEGTDQGRVPAKLVVEQCQNSGFAEKRIADNGWQSYKMGSKLCREGRAMLKGHPDEFAMVLLNYLLVAGDNRKRRSSGRIFNAVRERGAKVYNIDSFVTVSDDLSYFDVSFSREGDSQIVLEIISKELDRLMHEGASQEEMQSIKRFAMNEYKESLISRRNFGSDLMVHEFTLGGIARFADYPLKIEAVKSEDIQRCAREWMNLDKLTLTRLF